MGDPFFEQQQREQIKRRQEEREKQAERDRPFDVAKYQHELSLKLLEEQHKLNLEIHEKQAILARELHEKQSTLLKVSTGIAGAVALFAAILGAYLQARFQVLPQKELQSGQKQALSNIENSRNKTDISLEIKKLEPLEQMATVLKTVSSVPPSKRSSNP